MYYESKCKMLKKQGKLMDYKVSDGLYINKEGELRDMIHIKITPSRVLKHIEVTISLNTNGF